MAIRLTNTISKRFYLPQDESGETWVEVAHLKPGQLTDIEDQCNTMKRVYDADAESTVEVKICIGERQKLIVKKCIKAFGGFEDEKGETLQCTNDNKLKLLRDFDWFYPFIEECRSKLYEEQVPEEEAEKNS